MLGLAPGDCVVLEFRDTGHGMDPETVDKIFDPFFTTKEVGRGTGLGLSMVYGIVKAHGGHIACRSDPREGTSFLIHLPVQKDLPRAAKAPQPPPWEGLGGRETLLLVDDEAPIRDMVVEMLGRHGYRVLTAASGEEALEVYGRRGQEVNLVLLDIGMPGMGGKRCLQELLKMDPSVKVLVASGYSRHGPLEELLKAGAAGYVAKPFGQLQLLKKIREILDI